MFKILDFGPLYCACSLVVAGKYDTDACAYHFGEPHQGVKRCWHVARLPELPTQQCCTRHEAGLGETSHRYQIPNSMLQVSARGGKERLPVQPCTAAGDARHPGLGGVWAAGGGVLPPAPEQRGLCLRRPPLLPEGRCANLSA